MPRSIGACTPSFLAVLNASLWLPTTLQGISTSFAVTAIGAVESLSNADRLEGLVVTKPETPVEVLDAQATGNFVDWDRTDGGGMGNFMVKGMAAPERSSKTVMSMALVPGAYSISTVLKLSF